MAILFVNRIDRCETIIDDCYSNRVYDVFVDLANSISECPDLTYVNEFFNINESNDDEVMNSESDNEDTEDEDTEGNSPRVYEEKYESNNSMMLVSRTQVYENNYNTNDVFYVGRHENNYHLYMERPEVVSGLLFNSYYINTYLVCTVSLFIPNVEVLTLEPVKELVELKEH